MNVQTRLVFVGVSIVYFFGVGLLGGCSLELARAIWQNDLRADAVVFYGPGFAPGFGVGVFLGLVLQVFIDSCAANRRQLSVGVE